MWNCGCFSICAFPKRKAGDVLSSKAITSITQYSWRPASAHLLCSDLTAQSKHKSGWVTGSWNPWHCCIGLRPCCPSPTQVLPNSGCSFVALYCLSESLPKPLKLSESWGKLKYFLCWNLLRLQLSLFILSNFSLVVSISWCSNSYRAKDLYPLLQLEQH